MIRKISVRELIPGMYVVNLHKPWLSHDIWRLHFMVKDQAAIQRLIDEGIVEVSIDTALGLDIPPSLTRLHEVERKFLSLADRRIKVCPPLVSLGEERRRAAGLFRATSAIVSKLISAARRGYVVDTGPLEGMVLKMVQSISRNPDALVPLARLKQLDAYASEHAVATAALIVALARQQGVAEPEMEKLALGALVKDVGIASLDARLLAKPGLFSRDEFSVMQSHVEESLAVVEATSRLPETAVAVILEHHERFDGSGYPYAMLGRDISPAGRMAAIVDTYDAMASDRPYRRALSPSMAVRQIYEQSGDQFDPEVVAGFVKTVGVYPVGTLVRLESGHLAVVEESNPEHMLNPVVRVIYHAERRQYIAPVVVDLARRVGNHYGLIVQAENYDTWGISAQRWLPA